VLEKLRQMRQRIVEQTRVRLAQQQQLCQRCNNNIASLKALSDSSDGIASDAVQLHNQARFKATLRRVIDWQEQERALAAIEQVRIQRELAEHARREMALRVVMEQQKQARRMALERDQHKQTDAQGMQSWMRNKKSE